MNIPDYCPACGAELELVRHTSQKGEVYWMKECPEGDWFDPTDPPAEGIQAAREVQDEAV